MKLWLRLLCFNCFVTGGNVALALSAWHYDNAPGVIGNCAFAAANALLALCSYKILLDETSHSQRT